MDNKSHYKRYSFPNFGEAIQSQELAMPVPRGTEVLLKVDACGVCHTDLHVHDGYYELGNDKRFYFKDRGIHLPITLGHEITGTIASTSEQVANLDTSQKYLVYPWIGCGTCPACLRGEENICTKQAAIGIFRPGGYAEYVVVPHPRYLFPLDQHDTDKLSLLACSGLSAYSAVKKAGALHPDDYVAVIGCGGLGQLAIRILSILGVKNIIAVDPSPEKQTLAKKVGATIVVDPSHPDAMTPYSEKCAAILDFVGSSETVNGAIALAQKGGKIILVGLQGGNINYPLPFLITKSLALLGSFTGSLPEMHELIELSKQHDLFKLPIEVMRLDQANNALSRLRSGDVSGRIILKNT